MKIAYYKCKCKSADRTRIKQLQADGVDVRVVKNNPLFAAQARQFGIRMPFIVVDGKAEKL